MKEIIVVNREDIKPLIYFIITMFQQENTHRQGTSSKSDLIGGFIDRWINKIPEDVIFRKHLLVDKEYSVINDYFVYGSKSEKNAPDILGLDVGNQIIKFTEYVTNRWEQIEGMPHIEIKTFRKNQKLVSVRDTQLDDDNYYIFVESDIDNDYLVNLFEEQYFTDEIYHKINMRTEFIKDNSQGILIQPPKILLENKENIGTLEIITIIKGSDFKERATLCDVKEDVMYLKNIEEVARVTKPYQKKLFNEVFQYNSKIDMYITKWDKLKTIAMYAKDVDELEIIKINKKNFYCKSPKKCSIYNFQLEPEKIYRVNLEKFERNSGWSEYVALKYQFSDELNCTDELVKVFDELVLGISYNKI